MGKITVRNRNANKFDKNGSRKAPNWEYRFEGAKIDGKRTQITKAGFKTKTEAEREGTKAMAEYNNAGLKFEPTEISVADYFQHWLDNYCKVNVADSTLTAYRNIVRKHLTPRIGHYKLKAVTTLILQETLNDIYLNCGFTKSFIKNILKVIKGSFKYAYVTARLIPNNPAEYVTLPNTMPTPEKDEIIILSKSDMIRILERFEKAPTTYYAIITAYYTGLRVSEVYGLTWDCVDFENKKITVNKINKKIEKEGKRTEGVRKRSIRGKSASKLYFGACKTDTSYRTIDIGDTLLSYLKEYKQWQENNEKEYGELYTKHYLKSELTETNREVERIIPMQDMGIEIPLERTYPVFIKENGDFRGVDTIKYASKIINNELGIQFNFHALRHTHATMLIEAGLPVKTVSERLGHGNVRTTLETYVHNTDTLREKSVSEFERVGGLEMAQKKL